MRVALVLEKSWRWHSISADACRHMALCAASKQHALLTDLVLTSLKFVCRVGMKARLLCVILQHSPYDDNS